MKPRMFKKARCVGNPTVLNVSIGAKLSCRHFGTFLYVRCIHVAYPLQSRKCSLDMKIFIPETKGNLLH